MKILYEGKTIDLRSGINLNGFFIKLYEIDSLTRREELIISFEGEPRLHSKEPNGKNLLLVKQGYDVYLSITNSTNLRDRDPTLVILTKHTIRVKRFIESYGGVELRIIESKNVTDLYLDFTE